MCEKFQALDLGGKLDGPASCRGRSRMVRRLEPFARSLRTFSSWKPAVAVSYPISHSVLPPRPTPSAGLRTSYGASPPPLKGGTRPYSGQPGMYLFIIHYIYIYTYIYIYIYMRKVSACVPFLAYSMLKKVFSPAREYMF